MTVALQTFVKGANKIVNKLEAVTTRLASFNKGLAKASQFLETQLGEDPVAWKDKQLTKLEKGLGSLLDESFSIFDDTFGRETVGENQAKECHAEAHKCPTNDENNNELSDESSLTKVRVTAGPAKVRTLGTTWLSCCEGGAPQLSVASDGDEHYQVRHIVFSPFDKFSA